MAITSRCDASLRCAFVIWDREVTPEQWRAHFDGLMADPAFPPGPRWLVDARTANVDLFDEAAIADMGERLNAQADQLQGIQLAVLPNGAWEKASYLFDHNVSISGFLAIQFNDVGVACQWLGLPLTAVNPTLDDLRAEARRTPTA